MDQGISKSTYHLRKFHCNPDTNIFLFGIFGRHIWIVFESSMDLSFEIVVSLNFVERENFGCPNFAANWERWWVHDDHPQYILDLLICWSEFLKPWVPEILSITLASVAINTQLPPTGTGTEQTHLLLQQTTTLPSGIHWLVMDKRSVRFRLQKLGYKSRISPNNYIW